VTFASRGLALAVFDNLYYVIDFFSLQMTDISLGVNSVAQVPSHAVDVVATALPASTMRFIEEGTLHLQSWQKLFRPQVMSLAGRHQHRALKYNMEKLRPSLHQIDQIMYVSQTSKESPRDVLRSPRKPALRVTISAQHPGSPSYIEHRDGSNRTLPQRSQGMSTGKALRNHRFSLSEMATAQRTPLPA
jgi:hypothetical protein